MMMNSLRFAAVIAILAGLIATAHAQDADGNPAVLSADFWNDWKKTSASEDFQMLTAAQDCGCEVPARDTDAKAPARKDNIVRIAVTKPEDATRILGSSITAADDPAQSAALATVVRMRIPDEVQKQALELVPAAQRPQVEKFRANLSTGIPGLPGIYLGDNSEYYANPVPAGFVPVAGGSFGCRSK